MRKPSRVVALLQACVQKGPLPPCLLARVVGEVGGVQRGAVRVQSGAVRCAVWAGPVVLVGAETASAGAGGERAAGKGMEAGMEAGTEGALRSERA